MDPDDTSDEPQPQPAARHYVAFFLYLPVLAALCYYIILGFLLLVKRVPAGAYAVAYSIAFAVLALRSFRIFRGEIEAVGKDIAFGAAATTVLGVLMFL